MRGVGQTVAGGLGAVCVACLVRMLMTPWNMKSPVVMIGMWISSSLLLVF